MHYTSAQLQRIIDAKTKPLGALGALEPLALQIALLQQTHRPVLQKPAILVFAGDHGIAHEGVSAYPQEVTWQMVMNFVQGGAAINVFCRQHGLQLSVIDAGVNHHFPQDLAIGHHKIAPGTASFLHAPAMTEAQYAQALAVGAAQVQRLAADGCNVLGLGEMGIANTSAASMLMHGTTGLPLKACVGRGTGLGDEALQRKLSILQAALAKHERPGHPAGWMQTFGGFEMAMMLGAMLEAGEQKMLLLVDGFIATAVYAVALAMKPSLMGHAVFCHQGAEQGHTLLLQWLQAAPLLHMGLRLGEGTGCALAYPLLQSAVAFLNDMASFETAGVSEKTS